TRAGLEAGPTTPIALAGTVSGRSAHTRTRARRTRPWPCAPRASLVPRHAARQSEAPLGAFCRLHESAMQNASPPRSWTPPDRRCPSACAELWTTCERWLTVEHGNYTEAGEAELARRIDTEARALFADATAATSDRLDGATAELDRDLHSLIALNKNAMFAAD